MSVPLISRQGTQGELPYGLSERQVKWMINSQKLSASHLVQVQAECGTGKTASWITNNTKESLIPFLATLVIISLVLHWNEHEGLMHFMQDAGSLSNPLILPFIKESWDTEA